MTVNGTKKKRHTKPCKYFQMGTCPFSGMQCDFAHTLSSALDVHSVVSCKFYESGYCRNGTSCRFWHSPAHPAPIVVDSNWANSPAVTDRSYIPPWFIPPAYASPHAIPTSTTGYPSPFWIYDSYPQLSPPVTGMSSLPYLESMNFPIHQSRSNSVESHSSSMSFLDTPTYNPQSDRVQVVGEDDIGESPPTQANDTSAVPAPLSQSTIKNQVAGVKAKLKPNCSKESKSYKTVLCKFHNKPPRHCSRGDKCTFIHANASIINDLSSAQGGHSKKRTVSPESDSARKPISPSLPTKPKTRIEAERQKGFYPVTWRVIGGGVLMGVSQPDLEIKYQVDEEHQDPKIVLHSSLKQEFSGGAPDQTFNIPVESRPRKRTLSNPSPPSATFTTAS
ncbi:hypothetical protein GYMLUDRAFT_52914 [Collybiopsis luxurians FD-317 M1]|nr:hypothetical protein GYMLUDRAFT_52914 [Collybiopsis luxurians FD-317 M1]